MSRLIEVCDPTDFRVLVTIRETSLQPEKVYAEHGHVVLYEKAGGRRLVGYVDVDEGGTPYLYREEGATA